MSECGYTLADDGIRGGHAKFLYVLLQSLLWLLILLRLLRSCTSIRVPEVFAWSSDPANPVGAEYIIMEKMPGIALAERRETMNTLERYKIIDRIVEMEEELERLKFPAYGSLFLRDSIPHGSRHYPLPPDLDPTGLFCVGPSCSRSVSSKCSTEAPRRMSNTGPCELYPPLF